MLSTYDVVCLNRLENTVEDKTHNDEQDCTVQNRTEEGKEEKAS